MNITRAKYDFYDDITLSNYHFMAILIIILQ